jgi:hypothetical protein
MNHSLSYFWCSVKVRTKDAITVAYFAISDLN